LKCITMIDPATGWFEIKQSKWKFKTNSSSLPSRRFSHAWKQQS
jgi:hypothetical protein